MLLFIALMMVSRIPTYAGKTLGTRVPREWVVPMLLAASLAWRCSSSTPSRCLPW